MIAPKSALLVVDVQRDFLPSGSLAVPRGDAIVPIINTLFARFDHVYLSKDWHPQNHVSFASNHPDASPFQTVKLSDGRQQTLWPDHCVQHSTGADFAPGLNVPESGVVILKGADPRYDSYSAFFDNSRNSSTFLADRLREKGIETLYICGLATDVCVLYTVLDASELGFQIVLLTDACVS